MRVVVCGAGVVGAAIAYFLSRRGVEAIVVERTGVACAASGKSGGFLALDWCAGTPLDALARRSFALHARLPGEIGGDWGYRPMTAWRGSDGRTQGGFAWLSDEVEIGGRLGTPETTAQVDPAAFTSALLRAAEMNGARLRIGRVTGLIRSGEPERVAGVEVDGDRLEADAVVVAMGPWSILAAEWLPLPAVHGLKGHSIVFEPDADIPPDALFLEWHEEGGRPLTPEVYPRADGTVYVCGLSADRPLPVDPAAVTPDPGAIERLHAVARRLSPALATARRRAGQACFRPVTDDGLPLIGAIAGLPGAYVATGHSVWGILNAPATGEAMAALLTGSKAAVDLSPFDPARLPPFDPARLAVSRR